MSRRQSDRESFQDNQRSTRTSLGQSRSRSRSAEDLERHPREEYYLLRYRLMTPTLNNDRNALRLPVERFRQRYSLLLYCSGQFQSQSPVFPAPGLDRQLQQFVPENFGGFLRTYPYSYSIGQPPVQQTTAPNPDVSFPPHQFMYPSSPPSLHNLPAPDLFEMYPSHVNYSPSSNLGGLYPPQQFMYANAPQPVHHLSVPNPQNSRLPPPNKLSSVPNPRLDLRETTLVQLSSVPNPFGKSQRQQQRQQQHANSSESSPARVRSAPKYPMPLVPWKTAELMSELAMKEGRCGRPISPGPCHISGSPPFNIPPIEDFLELTLPKVTAIITRRDLKASSIDIYNAVIRWVEFDRTRRSHIPALLLQARIPLLPIEFLVDVVRTNDLIKDNDACKRSLFLALQYRNLFAPSRLLAWKFGNFSPNCEVSTGSSAMCDVKLTHEERMSFKPRDLFGPPKRIYLFGSSEPQLDIDGPRNKNTFEYFDCKEREWHAVSGYMPTSREGFAAVTFQRKIWIVGGDSDGSGKADSGETGLVRTVHIYSPSSNEWSVGPQLIKGRSNLGLVEYHGSLYAIGGKSNDKEHEKSVEVVRPSGNLAWTEGVDMNLARAGMGVAVLRSRIYAIGGARAEDKSRMEYFSSLCNQWTMLEFRISRHDHRAMTVDDELLYVFFNSSRGKDYHVYNPVFEKNWKRFTGDKSCIKNDAAVASVDGYIYIMGGYKQDKRVSHVSGYNPSTCVWDHCFSSCTTNRAGAKAVVVTVVSTNPSKLSSTR